MHYQYSLSIDNLFDAKYSLQQLRRIPLRPLREISAYVLEQLPLRLQAIRREEQSASRSLLVDEIEEVLGGVKPDEVYPTLKHQEQAIAQLDIRMLQSAVIHSGGIPGTQLLAWTSYLTSQLHPNILTYADLVLSNPTQDIRTFTSDQVGHTEASFYTLHLYVEEELAFTVERLEASQQYLSKHKLDYAGEELTEATASLQESHLMMQKLRAMQPAHYAQFRSYLQVHSNLRGPSGFYSPGMARLDLLFAGKRLTAEFLTSLETDLLQGYYPETEKIQRDYQQAKNNKSLLDLVLSPSAASLRAAARDFAQAVLDFRGVHHAVAKAAVPDVLRDERPGTSGETLPSRILKGRIKVYQDLLPLLAALSQESEQRPK